MIWFVCWFCLVCVFWVLCGWCLPELLFGFVTLWFWFCLFALWFVFGVFGLRVRGRVDFVFDVFCVLCFVLLLILLFSPDFGGLIMFGCGLR